MQLLCARPALGAEEGLRHHEKYASIREFHDSCLICIRNKDPEILQARGQFFCTFGSLLPSNFE